MIIQYKFKVNQNRGVGKDQVLRGAYKMKFKKHFANYKSIQIKILLMLVNLIFCALNFL